MQRKNKPPPSLTMSPESVFATTSTSNSSSSSSSISSTAVVDNSIMTPSTTTSLTKNHGNIDDYDDISTTLTAVPQPPTTFNASIMAAEADIPFSPTVTKSSRDLPTTTATRRSTAAITLVNNTNINNISRQVLPHHQQQQHPSVATARRRYCGTSPFDTHWLNLDCCGLVCAALTYGLHWYGCYVVCYLLLPQWMSYHYSIDGNNHERGSSTSGSYGVGYYDYRHGVPMFRRVSQVVFVCDFLLHFYKAILKFYFYFFI